MRLHDLKPRPGAKHRRKRLARGESSGLGKTSGRGHKGQKSRSGGGVRPGFEGGQMPINRRLPKKGFSNAAFRKDIVIVNLCQLEEKFADGATIDEAAIYESRLVKGQHDGIKILGVGELTKKFTVAIGRISASAREKIEAAGGKIEAPAAKVAEPKAIADPEPPADAE